MEKDASKPAQNDREARLAKALRDNLRRRKVGGAKPPASEDGGGDTTKR